MRPQDSAPAPLRQMPAVADAPREDFAAPDRPPHLRVVAGGREQADADDRVAHFFVIVATLCGDARLGRLTLHLKLVNGVEIVGVAEPVRETQGCCPELVGTGYADVVSIDGVAVALSDVIEVSIARPAGRATLG